jgi:hypothetical protein
VASKTKRALGANGASIHPRARRGGHLPEEPYVEGEPEPVSPEERAVVIPGRAWVSSEATGNLEEELLDAGLSPETLGDLGVNEETALGEPAGATRAVTATGTGTAVEPDERLEGEALGEELTEEEEAPLDRILAQRTATWRYEEPEEERGPGLRHELGVEAGPVVIAPRQADEFVCSVCFLVKRRELLADPEHQICRDCAAEAGSRQGRLRPVVGHVRTIRSRGQVRDGRRSTRRST